MGPVAEISSELPSEIYPLPRFHDPCSAISHLVGAVVAGRKRSFLDTTILVRQAGLVGDARTLFTCAASSFRYFKQGIEPQS